MFEPQYSISNLLLSNIKRITEIIADLNSRSFSGIVLAELEKRAREISAFSSTSIEGNSLPLTDVKRILKTRPEHIRDSEREVLNYNKALVDLNDSMKKNKSRIDPLILAGIFHKQFVIIHPFIDGNGRTARLATKVLLAKMGLNTFNLFSFENYYNKNVSKYFQNVGLIGNYYDLKESADYNSWLEYFTDGIIDELLRV